MNGVLFGLVAIVLLLLGAAMWLLGTAQTRQSEQVLEKRIGDFDRGKVSDTPAQRVLNVPVLGWAYQQLARAGIPVQPQRLALFAFAAFTLAVILLFILGLLRGAIVVAAIVALAAFVVNRIAEKRRMQLVDQLPGFLENVVRILQAGNTLEESFDNASREAQEPVKDVMQDIARQVRLGVPLEQALEQAGTLHRLRDFRVIALAVAVNRRFGGSIRNVFRSLIVMVRQRATSAKELKALTAETRFSAMVLAFVSTGLFVYIYLSNPAYYEQALTTFNGRIMFGMSVALIVAGIVILYRMTTSMGGADE
ncbi:MAG: hypothetical protein EPN72_12890 [Nevskiaceae bacterium]|nr:MAG: hypothetical protein EPN63_00085 [Nevskiaceae bacterium]TBR72056.1 MAG: hypothetical protein EPN72_12890 [Nevskiaceae bacterium]